MRPAGWSRDHDGVHLPPDDAATPNEGPTYQVLCIDDDPGNLRLIRRVLAPRTDIRLMLAEGGVEGLLIAESTVPDLILLDAVMPDLAGIEVARRLSESAATAASRVVVVSGHLSQERRDAMSAVGVSGFLDKPWTVQQLIDLVTTNLPEKPRPAED